MKFYDSNRIPTKLTVSGDKASAMEHMQYARKTMAQLESIQSKPSKPLWVGKLKKSPVAGVDVEVFAIHDTLGNLRQKIINIFAEGGAQKKREVVKECFCDCQFSIGYIVEIIPASEVIPSDEISETDEEFLNYYTVTICNRKRRYIFYENILANDFVEYEEGQKVLLIAYHDFLFDCCKATPDETVSGCAPAIDEVEDVGSEDWRTTYRILNICPEHMKWFYN